jgi:hypothetical protein
MTNSKCLGQAFFETMLASVQSKEIKLVIINLMPTAHDHYDDVVIIEKLGPTLTEIIKRVETKQS